MAKPRARRVDSSDCPLVVAGETYYPHDGEWIEVFPILTVGDRQAFTALAAIGTQLQQSEGDPDETLQLLAKTEEAYDHIKSVIAKRIVGWNWTGLDDAPLPLPRDEPAVLDDLSDDELQWLTEQVFGANDESASDRKNGSRVSLTTSSATARRQTRVR